MVWFLLFVEEVGNTKGTWSLQRLPVKTDDTNMRYIFVSWVLKISKNHQGLLSTEIHDKTVRMYETKTDLCAVSIFFNYLSKRNPHCDALFQTHRDSFLDDENVWFENTPLGNTNLDTWWQPFQNVLSSPIHQSLHSSNRHNWTKLCWVGLKLV